MNDRDFVRASMPTEFFKTMEDHRLFDKNLTTSQPIADGLDGYRMPEARQQNTGQSTAETPAWRAQYQAAPEVTRYESVPGAASIETQAIPGQGVRQVRYDQVVSPGANPIAQKDGPKTYSEVRAAAKTESHHSSKDEPSNLLVIGAELAIAALALRYGLKYLPKSGVDVLRESATLAKGAKGAESVAGAAPKPFTPDLKGLASVRSPLVGPDGRTILVRTGERNNTPLRVG